MTSPPQAHDLTLLLAALQGLETLQDLRPGASEQGRLVAFQPGHGEGHQQRRAAAADHVVPELQESCEGQAAREEAEVPRLEDLLDDDVVHQKVLTELRQKLRE